VFGGRTQAEVNAPLVMQNDNNLIKPENWKGSFSIEK